MGHKGLGIQDHLWGRPAAGLRHWTSRKRAPPIPQTTWGVERCRRQKCHLVPSKTPGTCMTAVFWEKLIFFPLPLTTITFKSCHQKQRGKSYLLAGLEPGKGNKEAQESVSFWSLRQVNLRAKKRSQRVPRQVTNLQDRSISMIHQLRNWTNLGSQSQRFKCMITWHYYLSCGGDGHHGASKWQRKVLILWWPKSNRMDRGGIGIPISSLKTHLNDFNSILWWRLLPSTKLYLLRVDHSHEHHRLRTQYVGSLRQIFKV